MEDLIADYKLQVKELRSLIVVLQKAVQNEYDEILKKDISNYLELALNKIDTLIKNINEISDEYNSVKL